ncbi:MAG: hypothetical protein WCF10_00770 [Polyangiales bacterium]
MFWHDLASVEEDTGLPIFPDPVVEDESYIVSFENIEGGRTYTVHGLEPGQLVGIGFYQEGEEINGVGHTHQVVREDYVQSVEEGPCVPGIGVVGTTLIGGVVTYAVCGDFSSVRFGVWTEQDGFVRPDVFNHDLEVEGHPGHDLLKVDDGYRVTVENIAGGRIYSVYGLKAGQHVWFRNVGGHVVPAESQYRIQFFHTCTVMAEAQAASGS